MRRATVQILHSLPEVVSHCDTSLPLPVTRKLRFRQTLPKPCRRHYPTRRSATSATTSRVLPCGKFATGSAGFPASASRVSPRSRSGKFTGTGNSSPRFKPPTCRAFARAAITPLSRSARARAGIPSFLEKFPNLKMLPYAGKVCRILQTLQVALRGRARARMLVNVGIQAAIQGCPTPPGAAPQTRPA